MDHSADRLQRAHNWLAIHSCYTDLIRETANPWRSEKLGRFKTARTPVATG